MRTTRGSRAERRRLADARGAWILFVAVLACGGPDVREPGMLPPPEPERPRGYSSTVPPVWISRPDLHPLYPPDRYFGAVGSSLSDWDDAGLVARRRLWNDIALRMNATRQRAEIVHPYVGYQGEFAARVADAFTADGSLARRLGALVHEDSSSFVRYQGVYYAFAYLDRVLVDSVFASNVARQDSLVAESVDYALSAAEAESWFGFAHWSRRSLTREADRLASWVVRNALSGGGAPGAQPASGYLDYLRPAADSLWAHHGWSLKTDFRWEGKDPPPQIEPRMKQRMVQYFLDRGFRIGLGSGCPSPIQPEEEDGEVLEPPPHHVLHVRTVGHTQRTTIAWMTEIAMSIEIQNCGSEEIPVEHRIGRLEGAHPRDAAAAIFRAVDFDRLDELLEATLQEIGLVPPIEFSRVRLPG